MSIEKTSSKNIIEQPQFEYTACHRCDLITTFVTPILLAVALSLTIYYAVHPIAPLIPIYGDFSLSLPIIICGSSGVALTVLLIVQIVRGKQFKIAFGACLAHEIRTSPTYQGAGREILHPGGRPPQQTVAKYQEMNAPHIEQMQASFGQSVEFQTRDGVQLRGYWHKSKIEKAPTVIFFNGNKMEALNVSDVGHMYKNSGFNILLFDYRGYGSSEGIAAGPNAELEAYYDAEAALKFVRTQKVGYSNIIAHGFSLGGSYAAALGYFFDVPYVILHNTFTSCAAVASHKSGLGDDIIAPAFSALYQQGSAPPLAEFPSVKPLQTDGFNTLSKVGKMKSKLLVIQGTKDHLMPIEFGNQLVQARYHSQTDQELYLINVKCGHRLDSVYRKKHSLQKFQNFFKKEFPYFSWLLRHKKLN